MATFLLLHKFLALLVATSCLCGANFTSVNYVRPDKTNYNNCPNSSDVECLTLQEYVLNATEYFVSDSLFVFLPGIHHLNSSLTVTNCSNVVLNSTSILDEVHASICAVSNESSIEEILFHNSSSITIRNLVFRPCLEPLQPRLLLKFDNVSNLIIDQVEIERQYFTLQINVKNSNSFLSNIRYHEVSPIPLSHTNLLQSLISVSYSTMADPVHTETTITNITMKDSPIKTNGISIYGCQTGPIEITNAMISDCRNVGIQVYDYCGTQDPNVAPTTLTVRNAVVRASNKAVLVLPLPTRKEWFEAIIPTQFVFINTTFELNDGVDIYDGAVVAYRAKNVTFVNCTFQNNTETALIADQTFIYFFGEISFASNTGFRGGAVALYSLAIMWFPEPESTRVEFINNRAAHVGGAIYAAISYWGKASPGLPCFIQIDTFPSDDKKIFIFAGNSAEDGGDAIYGAALARTCNIGSGASTSLAHDFLTIAEIRPPYVSNTSLVSSNPIRVCHCTDEMAICPQNETDINLSVYPGQYFSLPLALVGDLNGMVRGPIYAKLEHKLVQRISDNISLFDKLQAVQEVGVRNCTQLQYAILAAPTTVELVLSPYSLSGMSVSLRGGDMFLRVGVIVNECPQGLILSGEPPTCVCAEELVKLNVSCNITDEVIYRQGSVWIGNKGSRPNGINNVVFARSCPSQFCHEKLVAIKTDLVKIKENVQCSGNRSGVLCGKCPPNFSLAIGSNRCLSGCSNDYLSLLLVFALAGIVLVFFIKILNLTVAEGTINGLILYANIVGADPSLYYPSSDGELPPLTNLLSIFISWLNLDFGIETCFFESLDAYYKAWLQFVFPIYILVIALLIILASHYSVQISKIFGGNSVPVLSTLILLSYTKLLRTILAALSLTELEYLSNNSTSTAVVWQLDGGTDYLDSKHMPLFIVAVAVLILLWLPFTGLLTFHQWLQRASHRRLLCWVVKARPFFDAYTGPLKSRHRYWVGGLLLARCLVLLVFSVTVSNKNASTLFVIVLLVVLALMYVALVGCVYRKRHLFFLECSYILNLGVLSVGTLYVQLSHGNQAALVNTLVGIAFLQFAATVAYHAIVAIRKVWFKAKRKHQNVTERSVYTQDEEDTYGVVEMIQSSSIPKFRESLFEYEDMD